MRFWIALALVGCSTDAEVTGRLALEGRFGDEDPGVTGVDVDEDGSLILSTFMGGLWRLGGPEAEQLLDMADLVEAGVPVTMTDVAVLGDGRYAMTVPGVGVLYDANDGSIVQHFCYEPGDWGDWEVQSQETHSLAYDAASDRLISQPQTLTDGAPDRADVAEFDRLTGEPLAWHTLDDRRFLGRALAVTPDGLILAEGSVLYDYTLGDEQPEKRTDLRSLGIESIEGLAVDGDELIVLDGDDAELVWVRGW